MGGVRGKPPSRSGPAAGGAERPESGSGRGAERQAARPAGRGGGAGCFFHVLANYFGVSLAFSFFHLATVLHRSSLPHWKRHGVGGRWDSAASPASMHIPSPSRSPSSSALGSTAMWLGWLIWRKPHPTAKKTKTKQTPKGDEHLPGPIPRSSFPRGWEVATAASREGRERVRSPRHELRLSWNTRGPTVVSQPA